MSTGDPSNSLLPQMPAICIRGWIIEPLTTLDMLKVCGKNDWMKPEFKSLRIYDRSLRSWKLMNIRHVGHPGPFLGLSLMRQRAYSIDFDTEFTGEVLLPTLVSEVLKAIQHPRSLYDSMIGFDDFEMEIRRVSTFDALYDHLATSLH